MQKAVSITTLFVETPFYSRFAQAKAAGFDWVEIGDWIELDLTRVSDELRANGLRLAGLAGAEHYALTNPEQREDFLEHLSQSIAVAKSLNCKNVIIRSSDGAQSMPLLPDGQSHVAKIAAVTRALMDAAAKAFRSGVTLQVNPLFGAAVPGAFFVAVHAAGEVVKVIDSPALQLLFPLDPVPALENGSIENLLRYRKHVGYIHISGKQDCSPAGGTVDLSLLRQVVQDELDFKGIACFVSGTGDDIGGDPAGWPAF